VIAKSFYTSLAGGEGCVLLFVSLGGLGGWFSSAVCSVWVVGQKALSWVLYGGVVFDCALLGEVVSLYLLGLRAGFLFTCISESS
jgi:hypothetical protein